MGNGANRIYGLSLDQWSLWVPSVIPKIMWIAFVLFGLFQLGATILYTRIGSTIHDAVEASGFLNNGE